MSANVDTLSEELREPCRALIAAADAAGLQPRLTSTLRSYPEQKRLYRRFLSGQQGYPVLPPGYSAHEYGEAFDLVVSPMDALEDVGYTWQSWGGGWNPSDAVHFELPGASARAAEAGKYIIQSTIGKAMGQSLSDLATPATSYIPGVVPAIEIAASNPAKRVALAADLATWWYNLTR
jgi:hypothetical protein